MPLPEGSTPWPPQAVRPLQPKLAEWAAWYSGEPADLIAHYSKRGMQEQAPLHPTTLHGGIVGAAARMLWGKPADLSRGMDTRLHVPLASDIFQGSADLLFAEPPSITGPAQVAEYVKDGLISKLAEAAESCAALGGVYLRVSWDASLRPRPFLSIVEADGAAPEFSFDQLRAVTFWWVLESKNGQVLRQLERHELDANGNGIIWHGLYRGTNDSLGQVAPLTEHPTTAALLDNLAGALEVDGSVATGPGLDVVYVPNRLPNTVWRKHPLGAVLGQSDIARTEGVLDQLDQAYTDWMADLRKSKGRIIVPEYMLDQGRPGEGVTFDIDRDVFQGLSVAPSADAGGAAADIKVVQFDFDPTKYMTTTQELVETVLRSAGYSAQTFGEDEDGAAITATEVNSRGRRSSTTRDRKLRYWQPAVTHLVQKMLLVDIERFQLKAENVEVVVTFSSSTQETPLQLATTAKMLKDAGAASTRELVKLVHPDWTEDQIGTEAKAIATELGLGQPMTDPAAFGGGELLSSFAQAERIAAETAPSA